MFSETYIDHYMNPRNKGRLLFGKKIVVRHKGTCQDEIVAYVRVAKDKIQKMKYKTTGCSAVQAAMSYLSEKLEGKHLEDAKEDYTTQRIRKALGLNKDKEHAAEMAHRVLRQI